MVNTGAILMFSFCTVMLIVYHLHSNYQYTIHAEKQSTAHVETQSYEEAQNRHTKIQSNVNAETQSNVDAKIQSSVDAEKQSNVDAKIQSSEDAETQSNVDAKIQSNVDAKIQSNVDAKIQSNVDAKIQSNVDAKIQSNVDAETQSNVNAKIQSNVDAETQSNVNAKIQSSVDAETKSNVDAETQSNGNEETKAAAKGHTDAESKKGVERSIERQTVHQRDNKHSIAKQMTGWEIIYDKYELQLEVQSIHSTLYKPNDGDNCTKKNPGCIIVGVAKCGTRELSDFASMHPNIVGKTGSSYKIRSAWFETWKRRLLLKTKMPCTYSNQIGMIKADTYFADINKPEQIYKLDPDTKIVVLVREPVERIQSQLSFRTIRRTMHNASLQENSEKLYLNRNDLLRHKRPVALSTYDKAMERYLEFFKRDQILIIEAQEFTSNPVDVLVRLEKFLGIQRFFSDKYFVYNADKKFYCLRRFRTASKGMVCYGVDRGRAKKQEIDDTYLSTPKDYFKPHNERFFDLIGKRFNW